MVVCLSLLLTAVSAAFLAPSCAAARSLQDGIFVSPNNLDSPPPTLGGPPYNLTWTNVQDASTAAVKFVNMQLGTGAETDVRIVNPSIGQVPWPEATSFAYTFPADLDPKAQYTVVWQALGSDKTTVLGTAYVTWFKVLAASGVLPTAANPASGAPAANLTSGAPTAAPASGAPKVGVATGNDTAGAETATPAAGSGTVSNSAPASPSQGLSPPASPLGSQIDAKSAGAGISLCALGTAMAVATAGLTRWTL